MSILRQKMSQYLMCLFVAHQKAVIIPTQEVTSLGPIEYQAVVSSVQNSLKKKGEKIKLTDKEQYGIGKYGSIHSAGTVTRKFERSHL